MKYDKTTIIGLTACVLLFVLWQPILTRLGLSSPPRRPPTAAESAAPGQREQPTSPDNPLPPADQTPPADTTPAPQAPDGRPAVPAATPSADGLDVLRGAWPKPRDISIRLTASDGLTVEVDPDGGGVTSAALDNYARDLVKDDAIREAVTLSRWDYPFLALDLRLAGLAFGRAEEVVATPERYEIRRHTDNGIVLTETWEVMANTPYQIRYSACFRNGGTAALRLQNLAVHGGIAPPCVASRWLKAGGAGGVTVAFVDEGRPKQFVAKKIGRHDPAMQNLLARRPAKWLAVHSRYFVLALIAGDMADQTVFAGTQMDLRTPPGTVADGKAADAAWFNARGLLQEQTVEPGAETVLTFTGLVGPKKYDLLHPMGGRLETVVGMDTFMFWHPAWMGFLTRWLLTLLVWLRNAFGVSWGYGLAIITITVGVKIIFWPLTHHSTKSMRRMQELQPQIKALREKYKDDPQKVYRKQSELFKENNVSQFGGCMPMLLQLPVFFALFITFRSAIELRHASFLWAADLSMPDDVFGLPIRPLALLMGLTMLAQQRLTPSSGDPQQRRMMMFMSVFFIFLFYSMPSGLNLYWTVNQMLSIVQTLVTRQIEKNTESKASPKAGDGLHSRENRAPPQ